MKFRDYFDLKQIIFAVVIIAMMMCFAFAQSNNTVKVNFGQQQLEVTSSKYNLIVPYGEITAATLADMPQDPGEKVEDGYDDDILLAGRWKNDTWGTYDVCADGDVTNCIVLTLTDGQTYVFNRKSNAETEKLYQQLLTHIG